LIVLLFRNLKQYNQISLSDSENIYYIRLDYLLLFFGILILSYYSLFKGVGFVNDWSKHRSILYSLYLNPINPSIKGFVTNMDLQVDENIPRLVYYYGMHLPSVYLVKFIDLFLKLNTRESIVKLLELSFFIWNLIGLVLLALMIPYTCKKLFKNSYFPKNWSVLFIALILFAGLNYWYLAIIQKNTFVLYSEWGSPFWGQITSFINLWQWVPSQFIVGSLGILVLVLYRNKMNLLPWTILFVFLISGSTWCFIGTLPFLIYFLYEHFSLNNYLNIKTGIKNFLSETYIELISLIILAMLIFIFYSTKINPVEFSIHGSFKSINGIVDYIIFLLLEFTPTFLILSVYYYKFRSIPRIVVFSILLLLVIPLFTAGPHNDFLMRVSIPPLLVLMLFTSLIIQKTIHGRSTILKVLVLLYFLVLIPCFINEYLSGLRWGSSLLESREYGTTHYAGNELLNK